MLGVLIALAADRWMLSIDDRETEREYLTLLLADFERTVEQAEASIRRRRRRRPRLVKELAGSRRGRVILAR